jgi:hypothetical protein
VLVRLPFLLRLLVLELAVIKDAADGWVGVRRHLDEVEATLARHLECLVYGSYAEFVALIVDDENFPDANAFVDAEISGYKGPLAIGRTFVSVPIEASI